MNVSDWSRLPPDSLITIFQLLNDQDRCRAARTCTAWNNVSRSACIWRKRVFVFRGYFRSHTDRIKKIQSCIRAVGRHMKELRLECPLPNLLTAHYVTECVRTLFLEMYVSGGGDSSLRTFVIKDLDFDETWNGFRTSRRRFVSNLCHFLVFLTNLKTLDMSNAFISSIYSVKMLDALKKSKSTNTLETLRIHNYFSPTVSDIRAKQMTNLLFEKLVCLRRVSINICYLEDKSLLKMCANLRNTLQQIDLHISCSTNGTDPDPITTQVWKEVYSICPDLKVTLSFDYWPRDPVNLIKPELPLKAFFLRGTLWGCCKTRQAPAMKQLLGHLVRFFSKTLNHVSLILKFGYQPNVTVLRIDEIIAFWSKCPKLKVSKFSRALVSPENEQRPIRGNARDIKRCFWLNDTRVIRMNGSRDSNGMECISFYLDEANSKRNMPCRWPW